MIRDQIMRLIFIPFLGIAISYISEIITPGRYNTIQLVGAYLLFILASFCIWAGCQWIHVSLRNQGVLHKQPYLKLLFIVIISGLYGSSVMGIFCMLWIRISQEPLRWSVINTSILLSTLAVIVFTLVYEVLYLSKEREIDNKIVDQLDQELTQAEMNALRNELDPHFIFNSLNTLSHLIEHDKQKAVMFNRKLAEVYKYFLINKHKELVSLSREIDFIKSYFYLLQIRHDNKLVLHINLDENLAEDVEIIPCAFQILVENAIKHNEFTTEHPLNIYIYREDNHLVVKNTMMHRHLVNESTGVGLRNLGAQYLLMANKHISYGKKDNAYLVTLPVIEQLKKETA